jgi:outer membrane protein assembly factor BamB
MRFSVISGAILLGFLTWACQRSESVGAGEWPQFRGPGGRGVSSAVGLPETWSEGSSNIAWRVEVPGLGNSSPIVSGGRVFLTTATKAVDLEVERFVMALDLDSGELLWKTSLGTISAGKKHRLNTYAAPTPVTDGSHLFVHFGDVLAGLDVQGQILWREEIDPLYSEYVHYGSASSPVLTQNAVIVAQDREILEKPSGWLAAFDKKTGNELWRNSWSDSCCSYTTPLVRRRGGTEEVIFVQAGQVASFDSQNGDRLWHQSLEINQPVASPLMEGDLLAVFSGAHNVRYGAVMRLSGEGKDTEIQVLWETNQIIPQTSSPVLYDGKLYVLVTKGVMVCYDVETGRSLWRHRLGGKGGYHSSLLAGDDKVYIGNRGGSVLVVEAGEEYRQIATNQLERDVSATPAFAGQSLLIRTASSLYRISGRGDRPDG